MPRERKEYLTLEEAAEYIGKSRATLYNYMTRLGIKARHFDFDKKQAFLSIEEVERIKNVKSAPWKAETAKEEQPV